MQLPIYFISDNHFMLTKNELESKRREKLFDLFDKIKKTGGTLVIGGDFFDFWLQSFFSIPENYDDLITSLKSLYENKIDIHYVVGNHDYWDFGFLEKKCGCKVHKGDFSFEINQNKILITHGDGILINDHNYRLMKNIIRSSLFVFLIRLVPMSIMMFFAKKISNTKNKLNPKYPPLKEDLKNELENYAFKRMKKDNIDTLLMGHYHEVGIKEKDSKKFIHLGDWLTKCTITIFHEDETITQNNWKKN